MHLILLILSLVCFAFAAWQHQAPTWNRIVAVGLAALVASMIPW